MLSGYGHYLMAYFGLKPLVCYESGSCTSLSFITIAQTTSSLDTDVEPITQCWYIVALNWKLECFGLVFGLLRYLHRVISLYACFALRVAWSPPSFASHAPSINCRSTEKDSITFSFSLINRNAFKKSWFVCDLL